MTEPAEDESLSEPVLRALRELMEEDLPDLVGRFFIMADAQVATIRQALARLERTEIMHAAHALKGTSSNMAALRLAQLLEGMERGAAAESPASLGNRLVAIEAELVRVRAAFARLGSSSPQLP